MWYMLCKQFPAQLFCKCSYCNIDILTMTLKIPVKYRKPDHALRLLLHPVEKMKRLNFFSSFYYCHHHHFEYTEKAASSTSTSTSWWTSMKPVSPAFSKQLLTLGSMLIPPKAEISPKTRGTWSVVVVNIVMIVVMMSMIKIMIKMMMMIMGPGCSLRGEVQASFGLIFAAGLRSVGTCLNVEKMQSCQLCNQT